MTTRPVTTGYVFADQQGETRHPRLLRHLAGVLDDHSKDMLAPYATPGVRWLEVGAGASSLPAWTAGSGATVTAVDIEPHSVPVAAGVVVLGLDITSDPLPGVYDLIHARTVLAHLANREEVLAKLAASLAPGGVLVVTEFTGHGPEVIRSPDPAAPRLLASYQHALQALMREAGNSAMWGRDLSGVMEVAGLVDVDASYWAQQWRGGEPGCLLPHTMLQHRRRQLVDAGMVEAEVDHLQALLDDPRLVITNSLVVTVQGVR